jgi:hypothetical protein
VMFPAVHENVRLEVGGIGKHGDRTTHDLIHPRPRTAVPGGVDQHILGVLGAGSGVPGWVVSPVAGTLLPARPFR